MFDKFGEFDSAEELNRAAAAQKAEGDEEALISLALENGIDKEDAEDYMDGAIDELATPLSAALGKLKLEQEYFGIEGIVADFVDELRSECIENEALCIAVRAKEKSLKGFLARIIKKSFEIKYKIPDAIIKEALGSVRPNEPVYMGVADKAQRKQIIREYYLG